MTNVLKVVLHSGTNCVSNGDSNLEYVERPREITTKPDTLKRDNVTAELMYSSMLKRHDIGDVDNSNVKIHELIDEANTIIQIHCKINNYTYVDNSNIHETDLYCTATKMARRTSPKTLQGGSGATAATTVTTMTTVTVIRHKDGSTK